MKPLRVSWSEGMFLGPQHLQVWDRHHAGVLHARLRAIQPLEWGLLACVVDEEALTHNEFSVKRLELVFKDGLHVSAPDPHPLPPSRPLPVEGSLEALEVSVAVPAFRDGVPAVRRGGRDVDARFVEAVVTVADESDPGNTEDVPVAHANLRFVVSGDPTEGLEMLPVARLKRTMTGGFALDDAFIPPLLAIDATPHFPRLLNQTYARMVERIDELTAEQADRFGQRSLTQEEQLAFWYLSVLNGALPRVRHLLELPRVHPAVAFGELVSLAGALTSFVPGEEAARNLPTYAHDAMTQRAGALEEAIERLLSTMFTRRCVPVRLEHARRFIWKADLAPELIEKAQLILCVQSAQIESNPGWFTVHAKVGASDKIDHLIARRLAGVRIEHLPRPPAAVPVRSDGQYFKIDREGDDWAEVVRCGGVSVFVPRLGDDKVTLELLAVQA